MPANFRANFLCLGFEQNSNQFTWPLIRELEKAGNFDTKFEASSTSLNTIRLEANGFLSSISITITMPIPIPVYLSFSGDVSSCKLASLLDCYPVTEFARFTWAAYPVRRQQASVFGLLCVGLVVCM